MFASARRARRSCVAALALGALSIFSGAAALAAPVAPVYFVTTNDAVTGDAPNAHVNTANQRRWTIDAGADSYQNDFYERPTAQSYELNTVAGGGGQIYAAKEYVQYIDITQGKAGYDGQYIYVSIDLFGRNKHTEDNVQTSVGLVERYGFRIGGSLTDPQSRGGYLIVADNPETKN